MNDHLPEAHRPQDITDADRERAAMYALGSLSMADEGLIRSHLARCPVCRELVDKHRDAVRSLGLCARSVEPSPALLSDLLARLRGEAVPGASRLTPGGRGFDPRPARTGGAVGSYFVFAGTEEWEPTKVDGVDCRTLHVDADRATMLFRMAPGTSYPAHLHGGPEECLVLTGDLQVGTVRMSEGDYQFATEGSEHQVQSTEQGCVLLVSTSLHDEIL